jgi:hypothetical protein
MPEESGPKPRNRSRRKLLLATLLLVSLIAWDSARGPDSNYWGIRIMPGDPPRLHPSERQPGNLRVLFIGNSFTRYWGGQSVIQTRLARSSPDALLRPPILEQSTGNGFDLRDHWEMDRSVSRIQEGNWDYVVLQDHSEGPLSHRQAFFDYARRFDAEIKRAGAKTVLFMTWAREFEPELQAPLAEAYRALGKELGADVVPVGLAFVESRAHRPGLKLYDRDGKHPTPAGSYLTACCFYCFFYGRSPAGLSSTINDRGKQWIALDDVDALYLQDVAYRIVRKP